MGEKRYELSNHLGNVLAVITDRRFAIEDAGDIGNVKYYEPDVIAAQDYHPFGMLLSGRSWVAGKGYRYGFNGNETKVNYMEVKENLIFAIDFIKVG